MSPVRHEELSRLSEAVRDQALVLILGFLLLTPIGYQWLVQHPGGWLDDDAYFYAQIAHNIATEGVSSFDGVHVTDGHHLLWTGVLTAVAYPVSRFTDNKEVLLFFFVAVWMATVLYASWKFSSGIAEQLSLFGLLFLGKLLMETVLMTVLFLELVANLRRLLPEDEGPRLRIWALGALVPLARIDALPMVFILTLAPLVRRKWPTFWLLVSSAASGAALHFLINRAIAGSWFSVSSVLKVGHGSVLSPQILLENLFGSGLGYTVRAVLLVALAAASGYCLIRAREREPELLAAWLAVTVFCFGHFAVEVVRSWHYVPGHVVYAWLFFLVASREHKRRRLKTLVVLLLAASICGSVVSRGARAWSDRERARNVAEFVHKLGGYVPPGELIFQIDASGRTGYFSRLPIVNGDGLVNTHAYAARLLRDDLNGYLQDEGICYIVTNEILENEWILRYHGLVVKRSDVDEILRKDVDASEHGGSHFSLFRIRNERCAGVGKATRGSPLRESAG